MPRKLPIEEVVDGSDEEPADPEEFGIKWKKSDGDPPEIIKEFRRFTRKSDLYFDKPGVASGIHIPSSCRSVGILRAQVDMVDNLLKSRWRGFDGAEFVERVIEGHNNSIRFHRANEKKKLKREQQPALRVTWKKNTKTEQHVDQDEGEGSEGTEYDEDDDLEDNNRKKKKEEYDKRKQEKEKKKSAEAMEELTKKRKAIELEIEELDKKKKALLEIDAEQKVEDDENNESGGRKKKRIEDKDEEEEPEQQAPASKSTRVRT